MSLPTYDIPDVASLTNVTPMAIGSGGIGSDDLLLIGLGQFLLAVVAVALVYRARERSITAGLLTAVALPVTVIMAQDLVGRAIFTVSKGDLITLVVVSVVSGLIGGVLAAVVLEPELDESSAPSKDTLTHEVNDG